MKASIKKYDNNLQSQKDFSSLLLPRIADLTESRITYKDTANKAGSLSDNSTSVGLRFLAELQRGLALFVYVLQLTFFQRMPRIEKVSAGAPGVPTATVSARKRASKPVQAKPIKRYCQCKNIWVKSLQSQNDFVCLPLPKTAKFNRQAENIFNSANKAGSLFDRSILLGLQSLARLGGPASCYIYILQLFSNKCQRLKKLAKMYKVHLMLRLTPVTALNPSYPSRTRKSSIVLNLFQRVRSAISLRYSVSFSV